MALEVARRRFTVAEYHRMGEAGILREDDHVELIDGEIVEITPIGSRHVACVDRLTGSRYADVERRTRGERVACQAFPDVELSVDDVLGSR